MELKKVMAVTWLDSAGVGSWEYLEDIRFKPITIISIGQVVKEDKESITLCLSIGDNNGVWGCQTIPRGAIVKTEILETPDPGPKHG